jgi:hypothetical protein
MPTVNDKAPVLKDSYTISSAVASVELTGMTSAYSLYQVIMNSINGTTPHLVFRFQVSGTSIVNTLYDHNSYTAHSSSSTVSDISVSGQSSGNIHRTGMHNPTGVVTIYNSQDGTEYTYAKVDGNGRDGSGYSGGLAGCTTLKQNSVVDGIEIFDKDGDNLTDGELLLFGYV